METDPDGLLLNPRWTWTDPWTSGLNWRADQIRSPYLVTNINLKGSTDGLLTDSCRTPDELLTDS